MATWGGVLFAVGLLSQVLPLLLAGEPGRLFLPPGLHGTLGIGSAILGGFLFGYGARAPGLKDVERICANCGAPVRAGKAFCTACGAKCS